MLNLFSKLTEYVLGSGQEREPSSEPSNASKDVKLSENLKENPQNRRVNLLVGEKDEGLLKKTCYGKVTRLYDGAGVIDCEVYFTFDVIVGGFRPEVDSEVHFEAARDSVTSGWKATRVSFFQEWGTVQENGEIETIIGMATAIKGETLELNNEMTFNMAPLRHQSYSPCKGDWIKVDVEKFKDDCFEIRGVKPLREKSLTGKVNSVYPGYGYINEEIYFTVGVCIRGYRPCRGDDVQVIAVESSQGKCKWRAVLVEPRRNVTRQNSLAVGNQQQFMGNKMTQLLSDKHGLVITGNVEFGDVPMGQSRTISVDIKNTSDVDHIFKSCSFVRADPQFEIQMLEDDQLNTNNSNSKRRSSKVVPMLCSGTEIPSQETRCLKIKFTAKALGRVKQLIVFTFECGEIGRHMTSNVIDDHQEVLAPVTPYQRNRTREKEAWDRFVDSGSKERWLVPGERPTRKTKIIFPIKLKMYNVPTDVRLCIMQNRDLTALVPALTEPLMMQTHSAKFRALLYAEELQMELDMREFDLQNVTMDLYREFLSLHVPGLAEGRPSLLIGDTVVVSMSDETYDAPKYEGYIHEVLKDDVLLKFNEEFHRKFGLQECDVTFYFNRSTIRRAHQAVEFATQLGPEVLFPRKLDSKLPVVNLFFGSSTDDRAGKTSNKEEDFLYNCNLNERQRAAVARILSGQCRPTPYVLFGPPGTGKTVTLVEAILQVFHRIPASRIIACAPSNSAADLLAVRLHRSGFVQEGDMVRLNAAQRGQEVPEAIAPYCLDTDSLTLAAHYRIIISTCSTSGQLFSLGLRPGHFTHVFVDEAGQATEPDCLIPMGLAAGGEGQIILAGDPHQLGPVLRSTLALEYGLNISLLERLMSRPLYTRDEARFVDHGCYDPLLVTKLVNNYRSHPVLLHLPSALFYHNELRVCADKRMRESFSQFEMLTKNGVPLVFHGIKGEDVREGNSPSWFNPAEAVQIIRYVQGLKNSEACSVKPTDIGIISPYKKQVEKIRLLLKRVRIEDIKVGSVEEFQGQERPVIIISTVRSNQSYVGSDVNHGIGFLSNPKRFNVAITRAQSLLIVIGNPHVLCQDPYWCSLLHYCVMNDVYTGCDLPDLDSELYQEEFRYAMEILGQIVTEEEEANDPVTNKIDSVEEEYCAESTNNKQNSSTDDIVSEKDDVNLSEEELLVKNESKEGEDKIQERCGASNESNSISSDNRIINNKQQHNVDVIKGNINLSEEDMLVGNEGERHEDDSGPESSEELQKSNKEDRFTGVNYVKTNGISAGRGVNEVENVDLPTTKITEDSVGKANISNTNLTASDEFDSDTCSHVTSFHDNSPEPVTSHNSKSNSSHLSDNTIAVVKTITGSPLSNAAFVHGLPPYTLNTTMTDVCTSTDSSTEAQQRESLSYKQRRNEMTRYNDETKVELAMFHERHSCDKTRREPDSVTSDLTRNIHTSTDKSPSIRILQNEKVTEIMTYSKLGIPVAGPSIKDDGMITTNTSESITSLDEEPSDEDEDLEEFLIKPMT